AQPDVKAANRTIGKNACRRENSIFMVLSGFKLSLFIDGTLTAPRERRELKRRVGESIKSMEGCAIYAFDQPPGFNRHLSRRNGVKAEGAKTAKVGRPSSPSSVEPYLNSVLGLSA